MLFAGVLVVSATTLLAVGGSSEISGAASSKSQVIRVMTIASWDNNEVNDQDYAQLAQLAATYIDAHGGVGAKHDTIDVTTCNDLFTAEGAGACGRLAVAQHDVAVVGGLSIYDGDVLPIIQPAHIPWIGNVAYSSAALTSADAFPITAPAVLTDEAVAYEAAKNCSTTVLIDAGQGSAPEYPYEVAGQAILGKTFAAHVEISSTSPDYAEYATTVANLKPDCVVLDINATQQLQMMPALQQAGISEPSVTFYTRHSVTLAEITDFPSLVTGWVTGSIFSETQQTAPWKAYVKAINSSPLTITDPGTDRNTWASVFTLANVAAKVKGSITGPSLIHELNLQTNLSTDGLTPNIDFAKKNTTAGLGRVFNPTVTFFTSNAQANQVPTGNSVNVATIYTEGLKYMPTS